MQNFLFHFFVTISAIGGEISMILASIIVGLIILFYHKEERLAGFLFVNYMSTIGITLLLKEIIKKPRNPLSLVHENTYAFPSGHAAAAMTTLLIVFYLTKFIKNNFWKNFVKIIAFIWLTLIISARLYLKVHDIYDIFGGILISSLVFYYSLNLKIFKDKILKKEFLEAEKKI